MSPSRPTSDAQSEASSASAASWCAGPPVPRSRYVDAPTPAAGPPTAAVDAKRRGGGKGLGWVLQEGPRFVVAGAVVAAVATGFVKVLLPPVLRAVRETFKFSPTPVPDEGVFRPNEWERLEQWHVSIEQHIAH